LESGTENNPTLDTLRRLAKALGVSVAELVD
jgi:transcriptional regulator with XRE-family HTH domain